MNSFRINRSRSIRDVRITFEYQPVVTAAIYKQQESGDEEDETEVFKHLESVLAEVRQIVRDVVLSELTHLRNIKWHMACRI